MLKQDETWIELDPESMDAKGIPASHQFLLFLGMEEGKILGVHGDSGDIEAVEFDDLIGIYPSYDDLPARAR